MILSNTKIKRLIQEGKIFVGFDAINPMSIEDLDFDTTTLNLHLADEFTVWKEVDPGTRISADPGRDGFNFKKYGSNFTRIAHADRDGCYEVRQHEFLLSVTKEYIKLPLEFAARIEGRSSLGRIGLGIHVTAPTIHAGYEGKITLEIFNHSNIPVILRPDMKIAQLIIETVDELPIEENTPTFSGQVNPIGGLSRLQKISPGDQRRTAYCGGL
jgi:dCTP deaminase